MKKVMNVLIILSLVFASSSLLLAKEKDDSDRTDQSQELELTKDQKDELDHLYTELLSTHKKIINNYVEFGVISQQKGDFIISRIKERHERIKDDGFIPKRHKHKQRGNKIFKQE